MLLEKQRIERAVELVQIAKNTKLEVLVRSQAEKTTELEMAYADLKCEKENVTAGYLRLAAKHDAFVEAHAVEVAILHGDIDLETRSYTEYQQTVHCWLHELHEIVASSFDEVQVQRLPFPNKGTKVEEMIDCVVGEMKVVPDTVWWLNDNFVVLGTKGVLNMLNDEGCQELHRLHDLDPSCYATMLEDVPEGVHKLAGRIVRRWWKPVTP
jgi:hypothetical protein